MGSFECYHGKSKGWLVESLLGKLIVNFRTQYVHSVRIDKWSVKAWEMEALLGKMISWTLRITIIFALLNVCGVSGAGKWVSKSVCLCLSLWQFVRLFVSLAFFLFLSACLFACLYVFFIFAVCLCLCVCVWVLCLFMCVLCVFALTYVCAVRLYTFVNATCFVSCMKKNVVCVINKATPAFSTLHNTRHLGSHTPFSIYIIFINFKTKIWARCLIVSTLVANVELSMETAVLSAIRLTAEPLQSGILLKTDLMQRGVRLTAVMFRPVLCQVIKKMRVSALRTDNSSWIIPCLEAIGKSTVSHKLCPLLW